MSIRSIVVKPCDMTIKTKKMKPEPVHINTSTIRKLLLEKIKQHKKTQKVVDLNKDSYDSKREPSYSNLKGGIKPTFREWKQTLSTPVEEIHRFVPSLPALSPALPPSLPALSPALPPALPALSPTLSPALPALPSTPCIQTTFQLGKHKKNKTISILIKGHKSRRQIDDLKGDFKKTKINTIKNVLKNKNLIKFGTTAPSGLLREIYESAHLCGDIYNKNANTLLHNFNINKENILE
jgi:hypothetical protein